VYPGLFLRRAVRRAKQVRFRRERVPVEVSPDESGAAEADADEEAEKIEVHVHLHRGDGSRRPRVKRPAPPVLTGTLFDWQWYWDRLTKRPQETASSRWSFVTRCTSCQSLVASNARRCARCGAPRARRRLLPAVAALLGLASIAALFAVCAHVLGASAPEHKATAPLGQWTDDDFIIVEMPATPSPFAGTMPTTTGTGTTGGGATR